MGGEEDGMAFAELLDEVSNGADLVGIEAIGRFVENEEGRGVDERIRKSHPLSVAF